MDEAAGDTSKENTDDAVPDNTKDNSEPPAQDEPLAQDMSKKLKNRSRRDEKTVEDYMKTLNFVQTFEEKFTIVCKKYLQCADENKKLTFYIKQSDKRHVLLQKSKEQLQQEFNKTILVKSRLENLCRELQKQNKAIKEESLVRIREEDERRKETQSKFQNSLSEITTLLEQNNEKNTKLRDDNISMSEKFKSIMQQYQLREQQVDKISKQMTLESQLSDAKLQKANLEFQAEKERLLVELEQLNVTTNQYKAKIVEMQNTETALKAQLFIYTDKYDEFQNALLKSNEVFGGFKEQMEMMSKKIKKLEKESLSWKKRWETSQTVLLDMCADRQAIEQQATKSMRQLQQMQNLSRTLQAERTMLYNTLKEHNIEPPSLPASALTPEPAPAPDPKVDNMVANCAHLRQSLAHLQSQINELSMTKSELVEFGESIRVENQNNAKPKKNKDAKQDEKIENDEIVLKQSKCEESNVVQNIAEETEPKGTEASANESGKDDQTSESGKDDQTPESGKDDQTPESGKDDQTPESGKDDQTPESGKDDQTPESGKDDQTPESGKDDQTPESGKDDQTPESVVDDKIIDRLMQAISMTNMNYMNLN